MIRETRHATPTTTRPHKDVHPKQKQGLRDQFQLLEAGEGKKDILIAVHVRDLVMNGKEWDAWIMEGSWWIKQCGVSKDISEDVTCIHTVAGGFLGLGGEIKGYAELWRLVLCY